MSSADPEKEPIIEITKNGPIKVSHCDNVYDAEGNKLTASPSLFLCRCGKSRKRPYCDGSHSRTGFSGEKSPDRVKDRWKNYVGEQITVRDNRGICSHSGVCVQELASVFNTARRPWINADGAEPEEIIEIIKKCPSGALRYIKADLEHINFDHHPAIHLEKNGPANVTGGIKLVDPDNNRPASDEHYSLCRCGNSKNKPFCDGSHGRVRYAVDSD
jgi:CDGSH-type Zn-finger protein